MIIHKKELPLQPSCFLNLPKNAQILCVQAQRNVPCIWYSFDQNEERVETRAFLIVTTGNAIEDEGLEKYQYLGTFQCGQGSFIGHVYYGK